MMFLCSPEMLSDAVLSHFVTGKKSYLKKLLILVFQAEVGHSETFLSL